MDIKEQFGIMWLKAKANIDRTVFIVFLVILVIMVGIYGYEASSPAPEIAIPPPTSMKPLLPNDNYNRAIKYIQSNTNLDANEELRKIRDFNIFDYKYVRNRDELQKEADKKFERAANLYREGKSDDAEKIVKEILLTWPSHIASKELLEKIIKSRATPTPKPTPIPGANPAVPPGTQ